MPVLSASCELTDRLLGERIVLLARELDDDVAADTCARLLLLAAQDPRRDIVLHVHSPGGSPVAAMAVHDTIRALDVDVVTVATGSLTGPVPFLVASGTPGKRFTQPHSSFLLATEGPVTGSHPGDPRVRADHLARRRQEIDTLLARFCGAPLPDDARGRWLSAPEAASRGIVDHVRASDS